MTAAYIAALVMGLSGSLHCAGMCGPIMLFIPFHHFSGMKKYAVIGLYHFSRITAYALLALTLFSFRSLFNPVVQQYISIILGVSLLFAGLISFFPASPLQLKLPWSGFVKEKLSSYMGNPGVPSIAVSGFLNGLLPCGLVYMALSATLALKSPGQAVAATYLFGAGTLPVTVSIILFKSRLNLLKGVMIKKYTPVIVFFFGCVFLLRGLNLGIPYLSPKTQVSNGVIHSCCHKK